MSIHGLSFVGRFVLLRRVLYWRFHCIHTMLDSIELIDKTFVRQLGRERGQKVNGAVQEDHSVYLRR